MGDFVEGGLHSGVIVAVIFDAEKALGSVGADDEGGAREEARFFEEGRGSGELDPGRPGELGEAVLDRRGGEGRLVDIGDGNLEGDGLLPEVLGDAGQEDVALMHRVERAGEEYG